MNGSPPPQAESKKYKVISIALATLIVVYLLVGVFDLHVGIGSSSSRDPNFPEGGPAEFLYLDSARVDSYLGQIDGGSFDSEKVTHKLTDTLSGKLTLEGAGEAGGSQAEESFVEREVKPTEASRFFALYTGLEKESDMAAVRLRHFKSDVKPLEEGQFVKFRTSAMLSPIYLNPYLASRQEDTLAAIFPGGEGLAQKSAAERSATEKFLGEVGETPRVVFSLHPEASESSTYLMPMEAQLLTDEGSLLKYGGGQFTVVGKVVRIFPEDSDKHEPAYVDSATQEAWEQPLRNAPGELICRTDPRCASQVRGEHLHGKKRHAAIEASRKRAIAALHEQTAIEGRGAVILPVAIYK